jgi:PTS system mannose-specific IIA component
MVGLVVAAHGRLAEELVATAEQIVGPISDVKTVGIEPGSTPEVIRQKMRDAVHDLDAGDGVLVLADLFGGTPCKESLMLVNREHLEVLAGVNLPMLLKAASLRKEHIPLPELARTLAAYTQKNITCASELLRLASARSTSGNAPGQS